MVKIRGVPERLMDYFVAVGVGEEPQIDERMLEKGIRNIKLQPRVISRYPIFDYPDRGLNNQFAPFCFPDGIQVSFKYHNPRFHAFALCSETGERSYVSCLILFEKLSTRSLVIGNPDKFYVTYRNGKKTGTSKYIEASGNEYVYVPIALCLCTSQPIWRTLQLILREIGDIVSQRRLSSFPIERIIQYICVELPLPRENFRLPINIAKKPIYLRLGTSKAFPRQEFSLVYLFKAFFVSSSSNQENITRSIENSVKLVISMIGRQRHVFVCTNWMKTVLVTESLMSLMFPFTWQDVYIPVLPMHMREFLGAIAPIIMGVNSDFGTVNSLSDEEREALTIAYLDVGNVSFSRYSKEEEIYRRIPGDLIDSLKSLLSTNITVNLSYAGKSTRERREERPETDVMLEYDLDFDGEVRWIFYQIVMYVLVDLCGVGDAKNIDLDALMDSEDQIVEAIVRDGLGNIFLQSKDDNPFFKFFEEYTTRSHDIANIRNELKRHEKAYLTDQRPETIETVLAPNNESLPLDSTYCYNRFPTLNLDLYGIPREVGYKDSYQVPQPIDITEGKLIIERMRNLKLDFFVMEFKKNGLTKVDFSMLPSDRKSIALKEFDEFRDNVIEILRCGYVTETDIETVEAELKRKHEFREQFVKIMFETISDCPENNCMVNHWIFKELALLMDVLLKMIEDPNHAESQMGYNEDIDLIPCLQSYYCCYPDGSQQEPVYLYEINTLKGRGLFQKQEFWDTYFHNRLVYITPSGDEYHEKIEKLKGDFEALAAVNAERRGIIVNLAFDLLNNDILSTMRKFGASSDTCKNLVEKLATTFEFELPKVNLLRNIISKDLYVDDEWQQGNRARKMSQESRRPAVRNLFQRDD